MSKRESNGKRERKREKQRKRGRERERERESPIRREIFHIVADIKKWSFNMLFSKEGSTSTAGYLSYCYVSEASLIRAFST